MTAAQGRLLICSALGVASLALAGLIRFYGDIDAAPLLLQFATAGMGVAWVVLIVVDVVFHAVQGEGTACPHCGHKRPLRSFRLAAPCPNCGE